MDFEQVILGNAIMSYITALGIFAAIYLALKVFQLLILKKLKTLAKRTETELDNVIISIIERVKPAFYGFIAFYIAIQFLILPDILKKAIGWVLIIWVSYLAIKAGHILIDYAFRNQTKKLEPNSKEAMRTLSTIAKWSLWIIGALFIMSNLGINVTSAMAGLGIGGIAIALALQNILGDLFSSFAIYFDKPFVVGDFIVVGDQMGTVEKIGIKTTRIRALQGEEVVISNKELTSTRVQNFKKMKERRVTFTYGVTYDTPNEKLKKIPDIIKKMSESMKFMKFDRAHFYKFDDSALSFEVVYHILSPEYNDYMDTQQEINLELKEALEKEGIEFAFPTQTVHLIKD